MIALQPTDLFQTDASLAQPWRDEARKRTFHEAAIYSIAKMALDGASSDQLAGAKRFLQVFMNCAEPVEAVSLTAAPRLDYDVERRIAERHAKKE